MPLSCLVISLACPCPCLPGCTAPCMHCLTPCPAPRSRQQPVNQPAASAMSAAAAALCVWCRPPDTVPGMLRPSGAWRRRRTGRLSPSQGCFGLTPLAPTLGRPPDAVPGMLRPDSTERRACYSLPLALPGYGDCPHPLAGPLPSGSGSCQRATHKGASPSSARRRTVVLNALRLCRVRAAA